MKLHKVALLTSLHLEFEAKLNQARRDIQVLRKAEKSAKRLAQLEDRLQELLSEIEMARSEMRAVPSFLKDTPRSALVFKNIAKTRAAWRSAWEK